MSDVAIRVEGLTKRFDTVTALDGLDLDVSAPSPQSHVPTTDSARTGLST